MGGVVVVGGGSGNGSGSGSGGMMRVSGVTGPCQPAGGHSSRSQVIQPATNRHGMDLCIRHSYDYQSSTIF